MPPDTRSHASTTPQSFANCQVLLKSRPRNLSMLLQHAVRMLSGPPSHYLTCCYRSLAPCEPNQTGPAAGFAAGWRCPKSSCRGRSFRRPTSEVPTGGAQTTQRPGPYRRNAWDVTSSRGLEKQQKTRARVDFRKLSRAAMSHFAKRLCGPNGSFTRAIPKPKPETGDVGGSGRIPKPTLPSSWAPALPGHIAQQAPVLERELSLLALLLSSFLPGWWKTKRPQKAKRKEKGELILGKVLVKIAHLDYAQI